MGILRRRNMTLDSYVCEMCLLQREETLRHLFFSCPFAKYCWVSDWGVNANLVESNKRYDIPEASYWFIFCYGDHYYNVLVYMEGEERLDFQ
jgi:hypothetical protein